jgi:hypothetical protein
MYFDRYYVTLISSVFVYVQYVQTKLFLTVCVCVCVHGVFVYFARSGHVYNVYTY